MMRKDPFPSPGEVAEWSKVQQLGMVQRTILRLAFPGGKVRPKPGAYDGPLIRGKGERNAPKLSTTAS